MKKPVIIFVIIVLIVSGIGAYLLLVPEEPKAPEVKLPSEEEIKPKEKNTIVIRDFKFNPETFTVKVGDTVTWLNEDGEVHTIKSAEFTSPNIKNGDSYKFQFLKAGIFEYVCGVHPYMKGKVVVEAVE
ncbi:plastocyanin [candidate division WS5 bacterium]|uniref:Plastocyanin n=1 Tax=candidate division WS5 bacterium TaxID=2093353 RepID=A0A419DAU2_9BACT|nr:MAG: plastocyanin [candidate division WS5 bacterium]